MTTNSVISSEQLSFLRVIQKYERVIVPIMQRDYAQGRQKEEEIRTNFLLQLKDYLESETSLNDLDFVYGNAEDNESRFIPLDGQQRLTTLFLLHYYLALHDGRYDDFRRDFSEKVGSEYKSRFSYETRYSSTHFCDALFNNAIDYSGVLAGQKAKDSVSSTFRDFGWFVASWEFDPTIEAMLRMLDSIHLAFANSPKGLYDRLISDERPAITFRLLPLRDNGLNDDLYIKMNSRGLPLTRFEKIKAKIIQVLRKSSQFRLLSRTADEPEKETPIEKYFSYKIDTVWSYMFWAYKTDKRLERKIGPSLEEYYVRECDSRMLNFIVTIAANYQAVNEGIKSLDIKLLTDSASSSWASFSSLGEGFFSHLIDCLDAFSRAYDKQGVIPFCENLPFDIRDLFRLFVTAEYKDRKYQERILFYAYYAFLVFHKREWGTETLQREIFDWCRVVKNLTINNRYDTETDFCNALSSIDALLNKTGGKGILEVLASRDKLDSVGFDDRQFKEERIKSWLIIGNDRAWYEKVLDIESNEYLQGQIISILSLSGIEDLYDHYFNLELGAAKVSESHSLAFVRYSAIIKQLFNKDGLCPGFEELQLFRRALLSIGDYSMRANSNHCLLKNNDRDISWKRFLHQSPDRLKSLQMLLESCPKDNIQDYFESVIQKRTVNSLIDWRGILVSAPQIWKKLDWYNDNSKRAIRAEGEGYKRYYYPLTRQRMSGEHYELRTLYKYYQLKQNEQLKEYLSAPASYSEEVEPYILVNGELVKILLYFNYNEDFPWALHLYMTEEKEFDPSVIDVAISSEYKADSSDQIHYFEKLITDCELEAELIRITGLCLHTSE